RFSTPTFAILFAGSVTALATLLGRAVLILIVEVGSFAAVVGWLATCLAFCAGAGGVLTFRARLIGLCGVVGTAALIVMKLLPIVPGSFGRYEFLSLAGWLGLGLVLWLWPNTGRLR